MASDTLSAGGPGPAPAPPAWLPDPMHHHDYRYWDGTIWTDQVSDAGTVGSDPVAHAPTSPDAPPGRTPLEVELLAVIEHYRPRLATAPLHVAPDLPADQLRAAIDKYAHGVRPEEVLLFVDSSLRRNGKAGCIVTSTTFYAHEVGATTKLPLVQILSADLAGAQVRVNGRYALSNVFLVGVGAFTDLLMDLGQHARGGVPSAAAAVAAAAAEKARMPVGPVAAGPPPGAPAEPARPSIRAGLGQLAVAALLGIWPILVFLSASGEDCERDGLALVCDSGAVESTYNLGIVFALAFLAVLALIRGIVLLLAAVRQRPA